MKRIFFCILAIITALPCFSADPVFIGDATLEFRLDSGTPKYKNSFVVSVIFTTLEIPFSSYRINFDYNPNYMYATGIEGGETPGYEIVNNYLFESGHVQINSFNRNPKSIPLGEVEVAKITFYVSSKQNTRISFVCEPVFGLNYAFYNDPNSLGFLYFNLAIIPYEIELNPPPVTGVMDWAIY